MFPASFLCFWLILCVLSWLQAFSTGFGCFLAGLGYSWLIRVYSGRFLVFPAGFWRSNMVEDIKDVQEDVIEDMEENTVE